MQPSLLLLIIFYYSKIRMRYFSGKKLVVQKIVIKMLKRFSILMTISCTINVNIFVFGLMGV